MRWFRSKLNKPQPAQPPAAEQPDPRVQEAFDLHTPPERLRELARQPQLTAIVAGNHAAPASLLRELSVNTDTQVQRALAGNPNTPPEALALFAGQHPEAFFQNPVLPLLTLTQPEFLSAMTLTHARALITHSAAPRDLLLLAAGQPGLDPLLLRDEARLHVTLRGELGTDWRDVAMQELWALPRWHGMVPHLALREQTPPAVLERLAEHPSWRIRDQLARNQAITPAIQRRLAQDKDWSVRYDLARNPSLIPELAEQLARDADPVLPKIIARRADPQRTRRRTRLPWNEVATSIGGTKILLRDVLAVLGDGRSFDSLLSAVAVLYGQHDPTKLDQYAPLTPYTTKQMQTGQHIYRIAIVLSWVDRLILAAQHPATSPTLLRTLATDPNSIVRAAAQERCVRERL